MKRLTINTNDNNYYHLRLNEACTVHWTNISNENVFFSLAFTFVFYPIHMLLANVII